MLTHEWLGWLWAAHTDRRWFESQQHCYLSKLTELCFFFFLNIDFCLFWFQFKQSPCVRVWKGSISVAVLHLCACVCWYCAWRVEGLNVVRVFVSYCETLGHYQCLNGAPQITFYLIGTDSKKLHCLLTRYIFVFLKQIVLLFYDLVFSSHPHRGSVVFTESAALRISAPPLSSHNRSQIHTLNICWFLGHFPRNELWNEGEHTTPSISLTVGGCLGIFHKVMLTLAAETCLLRRLTISCSFKD